MQQVIINLLSNAIKFAVEESPITVKMGLNQLESEQYQLKISVQDEGFGMDQAEMARLFTPYMRSDNPESRAANPYGNGLGLSISQGIAHAMCGEITV